MARFPAKGRRGAGVRRTRVRGGRWNLGMVCLTLHRASGVSLWRCPGYRPFPGKRERVFQEVVRWVDKQEESRSSLLSIQPLRSWGRRDTWRSGRSFQERSFLVPGEVRRQLSPTLGKAGVEGIHRQGRSEAEKKKGRESRRPWERWQGSREEKKETRATTIWKRRPFEAKGYEEGQEKEKARRCRRKRPWTGRSAKRETEATSSKDEWRAGSTGPRSGRCGLFGGVWVRPRSLHLCVGEECPIDRGSDESPYIPSGIRPRDYEVGGFKRWYYEQEEAKEKEEQCFGSEAYQQPAAGSCRAAGGFKEGGSQEEEKQKRWHLKGKGCGAPVEREGEEDQEGRRSLRGWKFFRGGKQQSRIFVGVRAASAFVEEKPEESGQGASSSGGARSAGVGSVSPGRDGRFQGGHRRSEDGHVLQPVDQAVSSYDVPRHEGVASLRHLSGRAEKRGTGCSGRQPGFPVFGDSLGGERRRLESGAVPGAPSTGANSECTHLLALAGKEACSRGGEESGHRQLQPLVSVGRSGVAEGGLQRKRKRKREEGQRLERERLERPKLQLVARRRRMVRQAKLVGERKGKERRKERGCEESRQVRSREEGGKSYKGSEEAPHMMRGFEGLKKVAEAAPTLKAAGCALVWMLVHCRASVMELGRWSGTTKLFLGSDAGDMAVHRFQRKGIFPLRLGGYAAFLAGMEKMSFSEAATEDFWKSNGHTAWCVLSVQYLNFLSGCNVFTLRKWRSLDRKCCAEVGSSVTRTLEQDEVVQRDLSEVEKELTSRFMSYTGEEIPKMEQLSLRRVLPSLPPEGHGGVIPVRNWVDGRSRIFLDNPGDCIISDTGQELPKLQARMHIENGEELALANELVRRNICSWTVEEEVFRFRNEMVLNGMFGVPKSTQISSGETVLRLIMNLIPSNSTMVQLEGAVKELPGVTQYISVVLEPGQTLCFSQSDMTAAFYLFGLPPQWRRFLCFNLRVGGAQIEKDPTLHTI